MVLSVNTNASALAALLALNATGRQASEVQNRISSGLKVAGPADDDAVYSIAQNMRGGISGFAAVATGMSRATSIADVAIAAGRTISDLMIDMKAKAVAALDGSLDTPSRNALQADFMALREQIANVVRNAEFGGTNLISASATDMVVLTDPDGDIVTVSAQAMTATALNIQTVSLLTSTNAAIALAAIDAAAVDVNQKLARLGTRAKGLELHEIFAGKLRDGLTTGVGNLVDADLAAESARSQAMSVKSQLGIQALAIANTAPGNLLALFR